MHERLFQNSRENTQVMKSAMQMSERRAVPENTCSSPVIDRIIWSLVMVAFMASLLVLNHRYTCGYKGGWKLEKFWGNFSKILNGEH